MDSLIFDENLIRDFCKEVLPDLKDDEVLVMYLASRKKYSGITRSHEVLKAEIQ